MVGGFLALWTWSLIGSAALLVVCWGVTMVLPLKRTHRESLALPAAASH